MTVWMHKGGGIILRHDDKSVKFCICEVAGHVSVLTSKAFFRLHCVYIGRF